ncbi:dTDP-4-dehydrorhamnose 3,5-epimerase [Devosia sp.]|uniref:dTDP-4-dehydrorhamnose 3,5-epimerase n=1 Tax=Devosia sp. TaxID=1871048 RepID=UPI002AFE3888|nr:dTDP-4-dehydrorhamnose 3,5-epimerase [Devosia sp.]
MQLHRTRLADVIEVVPSRIGDERGYFSETFRDDWFRANVADTGFVQENQSLSRARGVLRGLHYQKPPFAQGKLVRCIAGAIFDVAVDIRPGSPTFAQWVGVTLSAEQGNQLWIPEGFLHGFMTLEPDVLVGYKVTNYYARASDAGIAWDDADIGVDWPLDVDLSLLSAKDRQLPRLADIEVS